MNLNSGGFFQSPPRRRGLKSTAIQVGSPIIDIGQQAFVDTGILRFDPEISFESVIRRSFRLIDYRLITENFP
jgi:hypothetical protein